MKARLLLIVFSLAFWGCAHTSALSVVSVPGVETTKLPSSPTKTSFETQVKPILQARCQPCHFSGGVMYQRLPFDRPETIKTLGTKLFTRLKVEKEQRIIREFLAQ